MLRQVSNRSCKSGRGFSRPYAWRASSNQNFCPLPFSRPSIPQSFFADQLMIGPVSGQKFLVRSDSLALKLFVFRSETFRINPGVGAFCQISSVLVPGRLQPQYHPSARLVRPGGRARSIFLRLRLVGARMFPQFCLSSDSPVNRIRLCCSSETAASLSLIKSR